ncbi:MAG: hypothetical protein ACXWRA_16720 [Pseudobdellovibrionaceae bacterium]
METQRVLREEKEESEEIIKITVTKEAGENLTEILAMVNEGFGAGKVNRQDIASWIIDRFKKSFSESDIQQIRKDFFSEKVMLESIMKQAKASGDVPDFLREALKKHWTSSGPGIGAPCAPANRRSARSSESKKKVPLNTQTNNKTGVENGKTNL